METAKTYPVNLTIDYPVQPLDRLTTAFRAVWVIPIGIIACLLIAQANKGLPCIFLPTLLMLVFRQKYPQWWFDWNLHLSRFLLRVCAYSALLTDLYPSTDETQGVHLTLPYPDASRELNPLLPLCKWLLALPHYVVLMFLNVAACFLVLAAWVAILFSGRYPQELFKAVVGVMRWNVRVMGYAFLLTTDEYPPFRLTE